ncbi:uncharacterized protein LY89DRAFT_461538 [Mollisia scopiformis]|uniref:Uncharacterized protein n=1 Tax=Mollisia scopiformis TaxID=149040 RepID=A0A194XHV4_MOLSC|nr:uncharacterized protein LY89DRAFT_461538 [Mollisia scopiformis]KUJ19800.1 hypothetical protein LY89DRAFT_461538 [Mollisia scopiformis]
MSSTSSSSSHTFFHTRQYSKSGIGGIGNFHNTSSILSSPSTPYISPRTSGTFSTSIGGAGNVRNLSERPTVSLSTKLEREEAQRRAAAKYWHHGIGGAGNKTGADNERSPAASLGSAVENNADRMRNGFVGIFGKRKRNMFLLPDSSIESLCLKD